MRNNPDVCKELLEILLEFPIEKIEMSQEEEIYIDFDSKGIRLDVYAKDAGGLKVYNIEMQASDTKELPERARYYQGVIDVDLLKSGQKYKYFFISKNCDRILNKRQKAFLRMVTENKASDDFTTRIKSLVDDAKRNTQWRKQYMEWEREKTYERDAGRQEKAVETARNLLAMNVLTLEQIAQAVDLPLEQVLELQKELAATAPAN